MDASACQFPDKPGFDCTEEKFSFFGFLSCTGNIFKKPSYFGRTEIRVDYKTGFLTVSVCKAFVYEAFTVVGRTSVLPYDCVIYRLSGFFVPDNRGFTLVGNTDSCDIFGFGVGFCKCFACYRVLCQPDFRRIVLNPARLRKILRKFLLGKRYYLAFFVK